MIIPGLFELLEKVIGPLISTQKSSIIAEVLGSDGSSGGIIGAIEGTLGQIEDVKKIALKGEIDTLLKQAELNIDIPGESLFYKGWRPFLAWGLSIVVLAHLSIAEVCNLIGWYHGGNLAPMDSITTALLFGLLGLYMGARTIEKVNSNADNN